MRERVSARDLSKHLEKRTGSANRLQHGRSVGLLLEQPRYQSKSADASFHGRGSICIAWRYHVLGFRNTISEIAVKEGTSLCLIAFCNTISDIVGQEGTSLCPIVEQEGTSLCPKKSALTYNKAYDILIQYV